MLQVCHKVQHSCSIYRVCCSYWKFVITGYTAVSKCPYITHMRRMYAINYSSVVSLQGILHCYNYPLLPLPRASAMRNCNSASVHITDGQFYGVSDIKVAAMSQPCLGCSGREKGKGDYRVYQHHTDIICMIISSNGRWSHRGLSL